MIAGTTASGQPMALSVGVTVKTAVAARGSNPTVIVTHTHNACSRLVVGVRGVRARCNVGLWLMGFNVNTQAGVAGAVCAVLKAPRKISN